MFIVSSYLLWVFSFKINLTFTSKNHHLFSVNFLPWIILGMDGCFPIIAQARQPTSCLSLVMIGALLLSAKDIFWAQALADAILWDEVFLMWRLHITKRDHSFYLIFSYFSFHCSQLVSSHLIRFLFFAVGNRMSLLLCASRLHLKLFLKFDPKAKYSAAPALWKLLLTACGIQTTSDLISVATTSCFGILTLFQRTLELFHAIEFYLC